LEWLDHHWYNARMPKIKFIMVIGLLLIAFLFSACTPGVPTGDVVLTGTLQGTLRPYPTNSATPTPFPTGYASPTPSPTVTPTATPVFYDVLEQDDMFSIGWRFNVSPYAIMTANPTVNPYAMSVGTTLLIPVTPAPETTATSEVELSPTPTPRLNTIQTPDCYPDSFGGLWCFVLVTNDGEGALENITGIIDLQDGEEARQEIAVMPLNLLPPGESLPLIAYFQAPVSMDYRVSAQIDFFLPVMPDDQRYLSVEVLDQSLKLSRNDQVAEVTGEISLLEGEAASRYIWVNATAFDEEGHVVAVRRWDSSRQLSPGDSEPFSLFLYSMGGRIDRVDLLVEARSDQDPPAEE
jgi:hypothetical protein